MKSLRLFAVVICALLCGDVVRGQTTPLDTVLTLIRGEQWEQAADALAPIVEQNPYEGLAFYYLGACLLRLERYAEAAPLYERAIELGVNGRRAFMRGAYQGLMRCHIKLGDRSAVLSTLREAWAHWGLTDLASLREDEEYAVLSEDPWFASHSAPLMSVDRVDRWRADIAIFRETLLAVHPAPFRFVEATTWHRQCEDLAQGVERRSDLELVAGLMRLAAQVGDGHTAVYPPTSGEFAWHLLPIFPLWLTDGWFIAAAAPAYAKLVGSRILGAGEVSIDEIYEVVSAHLPSDNTMTPRWLAGVAMQFEEPYILAKAAAPGSVRLRLELSDGSVQMQEVRGGPVDRDPNTGFAPSDWPTMFPRPPLWLQRSGEKFWHQRLADSSLVYSQVNGVNDSESQKLGDYARELRAFVHSNDAKGLILDLRKNNGGNAHIGRDLVEEILRIPGIEERGRFFVLIGPRSYSATGYVIGFLEQHCDPIFVGLASGVRPVNYSSERNFTLPNSELTGSIAYELRIEGEASDDHRPWFAPDLVSWPTSSDLRAGRDPLIELVLSHFSAEK